MAGLTGMRRCDLRVGQTVLDGIIMSDSTMFRADVGRPVRLLRAFGTEQTATEGYYTALARDTVRLSATRFSN